MRQSCRTQQDAVKPQPKQQPPSKIDCAPHIANPSMYARDYYVNSSSSRMGEQQQQQYHRPQVGNTGPRLLSLVGPYFGDGMSAAATVARLIRHNGNAGGGGLMVDNGRKSILSC